MLLAWLWLEPKWLSYIWRQTGGRAATIPSGNLAAQNPILFHSLPELNRAGYAKPRSADYARLALGAAARAYSKG